MQRNWDERGKVVERYQKSRLSIQQFSRLEGIAEQSLRNWIQRIESNPDIIRKPGTGFIEIRTSVPTATGMGDSHIDLEGQPQGLKIRFPNGAVMEIQSDTDRRTLPWALALVGYPE